jgi:hypothetical protein
MGTSKGYEAPTTPQWSELKRAVTKLSGKESISPNDIGRVLNRLINALGGAKGISSGQFDRTVGASAVNAGRNLSSFIKSVSSQGFEKTLEETGLQHLRDQKAGDIIFSLLDELCGDGSSIDEVDARNAMYDLENELLEGTDSYEQVSNILNAELKLESLDKILFSYFGYYLYHIFERIFHERIFQRKGETELHKIMPQIKTYIKKELKYQTAEIEISKVDWQTKEGQEIIESVLHQTLSVFGRS